MEPDHKTRILQELSRICATVNAKFSITDANREYWAMTHPQETLPENACDVYIRMDDFCAARNADLVNQIAAIPGVTSVFLELARRPSSKDA